MLSGFLLGSHFLVVFSKELYIHYWLLSLFAFQQKRRVCFDSVSAVIVVNKNNQCRYDETESRFLRYLFRLVRRTSVIHHIKVKSAVSVNTNVPNASESGCRAIHGPTWDKNASNAISKSIRINK